MKKLFALLLCMLLAAGCAAFAEGTTDAARYYISGEELVLVERDGIALAFTGAHEGIGANTFFTIAVRNGSDKDLYISYKLQDDKAYRSFGSEFMPAGETTEDVMCLGVDMATADTVAVTIMVEDYEMWDLVFSEDVVFYVNAERDGLVFQPDCEMALFAQDGVKLAFTGVVEEGETTRLEVQGANDSGKDVEITCAQTGFVMTVPANQTAEGAMEFALPYADMSAMELLFAVKGTDGTQLFEAQKQIIRFKAPVPPLEVGSRGDDVQALQQQLIDLGYLEGDADGIYGGMTAEAVLAFQAAEGLPETGVADSRTQNALFAK